MDLRFVQKKVGLIACFLLLSISVTGQQIGDVVFTNCFLTDCNGFSSSDRARFGHLYVPENYSNEESSLLKIAFVILRATGDTPKADPIIMFQGGWGAPTLKNISYYAGLSLNVDRDIILLDYRGSGYSEPELCPWLGTTVFDLVLDNQNYQTSQNNLNRSFDDCLDSLSQQNIDHNQYGTFNKARDAVLLAEELGYGQYNLMATSYGTRAIQCFLAQATVRVRSVIMDSNCPVGFPVNGSLLQDFVGSFRNVLQDCDADPVCAEAYPNLEKNYRQFLESLDRRPMKVKLYQDKVAFLNRQEVNAVVHQMLYDAENYANFPYVLDKLSKRSHKLMRDLIWDIDAVIADNFNGLGLINYVYDHKPFQAKNREFFAKGRASDPLYELFDGYQAYFFQDTRFTLDTLESKPVASVVPALILAGTYDPVTPPYFSRFLLPNFENHFYFEFDKAGHGIVNDKCGMELVVKFLNDPEARPDAPCLGQLTSRRIPFFVRGKR